MTKRVLLLLTGTCEQRGLPPALEAAFAGVDVTFELYGEYQSFTSDSVPIADIIEQSSDVDRGPVDKLASALIDAGRERGCDLAIAVDDLELVNVGRASDVRALFRSAFVREAARGESLTTVERARLAARCSFHILAPMVEAYFFGEPAAIDRAFHSAKAPAGTTWTTTSPSVEAFLTSDAGYTDRVTSPDLPKTERHGDKTLAWRAANREKHPKHYMEFLCRNAPLGYREGRAGVAALEKLDFPRVLAGGAPHLAELLADLEDGLGLPSVLGAGVPPRAAGVLRNL